MFTHTQKGPIDKRPLFARVQLNYSFYNFVYILNIIYLGKSSLVLRFVKGQFHEYQESTIGAAFLTQTVRFSPFFSPFFLHIYRVFSYL